MPKKQNLKNQNQAILTTANYGVIGVGTDKLLYTRETLTSDWKQIPNSGAVIGIAIMPDGKIVGIGMDKLLYTRETLTSDWKQIPNSGSVIGITIMPDGKIVGIGTDNLLWTRETLTSDWKQIPNSGSVIAVTCSVPPKSKTPEPVTPNSEIKYIAATGLEDYARWKSIYDKHERDPNEKPFRRGRIWC